MGGLVWVSALGGWKVGACGVRRKEVSGRLRGGSEKIERLEGD